MSTRATIIFNMMHSLTIMTDGCANFRNSWSRTKPNQKKIKEYVPLPDAGDCALARHWLSIQADA